MFVWYWSLRKQTLPMQNCCDGFWINEPKRAHECGTERQYSLCLHGRYSLWICLKWRLEGLIWLLELAVSVITSGSSTASWCHCFCRIEKLLLFRTVTPTVITRTQGCQSHPTHSTSNNAVLSPQLRVAESRLEPKTLLLNAAAKPKAVRGVTVWGQYQAQHQSSGSVKKGSP